MNECTFFGVFHDTRRNPAPVARMPAHPGEIEGIHGPWARHFLGFASKEVPVRSRCVTWWTCLALIAFSASASAQRDVRRRPRASVAHPAPPRSGSTMVPQGRTPMDQARECVRRNGENVAAANECIVRVLGARASTVPPSGPPQDRRPAFDELRRNRMSHDRWQ